MQDETSVKENGLCEIKIVDNQIMNFNNRSDFLPEILSKLDGIEYYLNDFTSTGIMYYDLLDRYTVKIGDNEYSCVMLNDECDITQGLEELIYTEEPETSETDYTKADKTDRKINQTYIIVDKQNQQIESVISQTTTQNEKINRVTQTVDELNSKISDIADITTSQETNTGTLTFEEINQSEPIRIEIHPLAENISYLYPNDNLYPSDTLFSKTRTLRFTNTTTDNYVDYELPTDLLYYDSDNYDQFILDYAAQTCIVNKRIGYNADGTTYILEKSTTIEYEYPQILLEDGDYTITLLGYDTAYLMIRLMSQNIYTTQFATKAELNTEISQTTKDITLSVDKKLTNYSTTTEMNSAINLSAEGITSTVSNTYETKSNANNTYVTKTELTTTKSEIKQTTDSITTEVSKKVNETEVVSTINQSAEEIKIKGNRFVVESDNFKLTKDGTMTCTNGNFTRGNVNLDDDGLTAYEGKIRITGPTFINGQYSKGIVIRKIGSPTNYISNPSIFIHMYDGEPSISFSSSDGISSLNISTSEMYYASKRGAIFSIYDNRAQFLDIKNIVATDAEIQCKLLTQTSLVTEKKNFEKLENGLEIIKNIDIYKYNLKSEKDTDKKHIGFVIGDNYNYSEEVTSIDNQGVDNYSFTSLCCKAIQEQQKLIEQLQEEINKLKEDK